MWSRSILKSNAKMAIRSGKYWAAFLVSLVAVALPIFLQWITGYDEVMNQLMEAMGTGIPGPNSLLVLGYQVGLLLLQFLVLAPLSVGIYGFFVRNRFDAGRFSDLGLAFRGGYGNVVITGFITDLITGLWSLLFVIPGIVKALQYSMVPFLLSDNPRISNARAREISRKMTDGEKGAILVLILSFIGWFLLPVVVVSFVSAFLPAIIPDAVVTVLMTLAITLVMPYYYATYAELYIFLRDRAIQTGIVQPQELNL